MKKLIAMITLSLLLCSLSACTQGAYESSYQEGYSDGYSAAEIEMEYLLEEEFLEGYDLGYEEGYWDAKQEYSDYWELEQEAIHYAREYSEWSPEEAWMVIEAYQNNEPFHVDGSSPSKEEYLDAIDSLIYFYDYFYSRKYK